VTLPGANVRIAIASDHEGFEMKTDLATWLAQAGHQVQDLGTNSTVSVDYPDYAEAVGLAVSEQRADRGVIVCGSGVGAAVAANKIPGIRCCICHDSYSAHQSVEHDNLNMLALGARVIGSAVARELVDIWLKAQFTGETRHVRRLGKIRKMEEEFASRLTPGKESVK
jgi:RpiB/LacA/LacB family sugar-phosphate isomerase